LQRKLSPSSLSPFDDGIGKWKRRDAVETHATLLNRPIAKHEHFWAFFDG
jgi:hypothetical protein